MRRGEILALKWDDIDFPRATATIRESKNGYSRTIPLTPKALNILDNTLICVGNGIASEPLSLNTSMNINKLSYTTIDRNNSSEIVQSYPYTSNPVSYTSVSSNQEPKLSPSANVFPTTANAVRLLWQRITKEAGIVDLHFHDLRHEAISRFFELGLTVPEVASISGHRDARMLLRYAHGRLSEIHRKLGTNG